MVIHYSVRKVEMLKLLREKKTLSAVALKELGEYIIQGKKNFNTVVFFLLGCTKTLKLSFPVIITNKLVQLQFCNIAEIEPVPTEETLVSAFQKLDEKGEYRQ